MANCTIKGRKIPGGQISRFRLMTHAGVFFFLFMLMAAPVSMKAQTKGNLHFVNTEHHFGDIKEEKGIAETVFYFTNTGLGPIVLTAVRASCGCTTPTWTADTLQPGDGGSVKVAYNPSNRPGRFSKTITVFTNGDPEVQEFRIDGNVIPRERGPREFYPFSEGNLRFKTNHLTLGTVYHDEIKQQFTVIYNEGTEPIEIDLAHTTLPAHILMSIDKTVIKPGSTASLIVKYSAKIKADWGLVMDQVFLQTNDKEKPLKPFYITADIREKFTPGTTDVPVVKFDPVSIDLGTLKAGPVIRATFKMMNTGKAKLEIRKVMTACSCMDAVPGRTTLEPGESTAIEVAFRSQGRVGRQIKEMTVITNAPGNPVQVLKLITQLGDE